MTPTDILTWGLWTVVILAGLLMLALAKLNRETTWRRCRDCKHFFRGNAKMRFLPPDSDGTFHWDECQGCKDIRRSFAQRDREISELYRK